MDTRKDSSEDSYPHYAGYSLSTINPKNYDIAIREKDYSNLEDKVLKCHYHELEAFLKEKADILLPLRLDINYKI